MMKIDEIQAMLRGHLFFTDLPNEVLQKIASQAVVRHYPRHGTIFMQGERGDRLFAIVSGRLKVSVFSEEGREVVLAIMQEGEFFGEIAVLDSYPRTADVIALEPSQIFSISNTHMLRLMKEHPEICQGIIQTLCGRLRMTNKTVEDSVFLTISARLTKTMVRMARSFGKECSDGILIDIKLSQQELANMIGTSREVVNRHLRQLKQQNVISLRHGYIVVRDSRYLQKYTMDNH